MGRVRRVSDRRELEHLVDEYITRGYRVVSRDDGSTRLKERDWGDGGSHLLLLLLTAWWSFGLLNGLYAVYRYSTAEEIVVTIEEGDADAEVEADANAEVEAEAEAVEFEESRSSETTNRGVIAYVALQLVSLLVTGVVLVTIFTVHTGLTGGTAALAVLATLAMTVGLRYAALYHQFATARRRLVAVGLGIVGFGGAGVLALRELLEDVTVSDLESTLGAGSVHLWPEVQLPEWWIAIFLGVAATLAVVGAVSSWDRSPYPKPGELRETPASPVYYGVICSFFGLWSILFAGISLQRVVIFAPIFEEVAKFGVALLVGSALFGRSLPARIGVALVVGSLFGVVEHVTTYPTETDSLYLFRTLFHMMTTVLSVTVYTKFEARAGRSLQWVAPGYSILVHFFYNTFAVLSAVIGLAVFDTQSIAVVQLYGGAALLVTTALFVLAMVSKKGLAAVYEPLDALASNVG